MTETQTIPYEGTTEAIQAFRSYLAKAHRVNTGCGGAGGPDGCHTCEYLLNHPLTVFLDRDEDGRGLAQVRPPSWAGAEEKVSVIAGLIKAAESHPLPHDECPDCLSVVAITDAVYRRGLAEGLAPD